MLHRAARLATIALLVAGALATIALVAWSINIRQTTYGPGPGRAGLRSGLELAARLDSGYLVALCAAAVLALALAWFVYARQAWAYVTATTGSVLCIAGVWWGRHFIVQLEDPHFVKRSPWVKAATFVATVATIYLALVAVAALAAWLTARNQRTRDPR